MTLGVSLIIPMIFWVCFEIVLSVVNANTDTKSTVSVIRVSSPTPSMEVDEDDDDGENSTKQSDADDDNHSDSDGSSKSSSESDPDSDDDQDSEKHNKSKRKKKKNRNKVRSFGLTVEDFYNPQQAVNFATEIMSKEDTDISLYITTCHWHRVHFNLKMNIAFFTFLIGSI